MVFKEGVFVMSEVKVAVVGYGNVGRGVIASIRNNPDIKLCCVVSRSPERVKKEVDAAPIFHVSEAEAAFKKTGAEVAILCGGSKDDLPEEIRPTSGYGNTYAKMWWKKPAPTMTRNFATPSSSRCIHPRDSRSLTTREGARLQSFPDDYKFYGSRSRKNLEVGNAVPPLLSIALAKQVEKALKK